jgi:tetratricopeptide (TPR) repeat protein
MDYYNILAQQPPNEPNFNEIFAFYYNLKGTAKADEGKFQEALEYFDKALDLIADFSAALFNRATIKADIGDFTGAREDFIKLREVEKDYDENLKLNFLSKTFNEKLKNRINIF